jgi:hypothetical protein
MGMKMTAPVELIVPSERWYGVAQTLYPEREYDAAEKYCPAVRDNALVNLSTICFFHGELWMADNGMSSLGRRL